jgi:hypothetical protein
MPTPFDDVIAEIKQRGFHNHRLEEHSATVNRGLLKDLAVTCDPFRRDIDSGIIRSWVDSPSPGGRARKLDLIVGEPLPDSDEPNLSKLRICVEHKSVITAHRNRTNRFDDLDDVRSLLHKIRPESILVATVLIGVAERVLNVPDRIKPFIDDFEAVRRRLSIGDQALWTEFPRAVSVNRPTDPRRTIEKFRELPIRAPGQTHLAAYDFVLIVPVLIDNVNPPCVARENDLGIDVDREYKSMLDRICKAYTARWHWD